MAVQGKTEGAGIPRGTAGSATPRTAAGRAMLVVRSSRPLHRTALAFFSLVALALLLSAATWVPPGRAGGNLLGEPGRVGASPFLRLLGFGAFPLFGMLLFRAGSTLWGRRARNAWIVAGGVFLTTLGTAGLAELALDAAPFRAAFLEGPGGSAGAALTGRLLALGGGAAALLVLVAGLAAGLVAATEGLVIALAKDAGAAAAALYERVRTWIPGLVNGARRRARALRQALKEADGAAAPARASSAAVRERSHPTPKPRAPIPPGPENGPGHDPDGEHDDGDDEEDEEGRARTTQLELDFEPGPTSRPDALPSPSKDRRPPKPPKPSKKGPARKGTGGYEFPPASLLDPVKLHDPRVSESIIAENAEILAETLRDFKVEAEVVAHCRGPVVTMFELDLAAGVKVNRIHNLAEDLAVALKAPSVRVVSPIPGKSTIGVEVPNPVRDDVRLGSLIHSQVFERNPGYLPLFLGMDVAGNPIIEDLTSMPHLLIAGATGAGKSVCINAILLSLLLTRTPEQVRLILIDPKQVELAFFAKVPHLMSPVVTEMKKALGVLEWLVDQMEQRYALFHTMEVRNIASYNEMGPARIRERKVEIGIDPDEELDGLGIPDHLPYVVIVVDELADLMMVAGKDIEMLVTRLAQKSRAVGIHIVLATQRPSTDVITGLIKANMPCRLSFQVASKIDSRVVLDQNGAEKLLGRGDMLYLPPRTSHLARAQCTFVSDGEVKRVVKFLAAQVTQQFEPSLTRTQTGPVLQSEERDPLYDEAVRVILGEQRGSASLLQRALGIGYTRGSRIMDQMHKEGLVGSYKGSKAREVLMTLEEYEGLHDDTRGNQ